MKLSSAAAAIRTGDMFLFRHSKTLFGRLIRIWTQSPYSHIGVAMWINADGHKVLAIIEALEGSGVRLFPMDRYVADFAKSGGVIDWYEIVDQDINRDKIAGYCMMHWGNQYASPWQFIRSWFAIGKWWRKLRGLPADQDTSRDFCSELASAALLYAGYNPDTPDAYEAATETPLAVAMLPCLHKRATLEVG